MTGDKTRDRSSGNRDRALLARIPGEASSKSSDLSEARAAPSEREGRTLWPESGWSQGVRVENLGAIGKLRLNQSEEKRLGCW